MKEITDPKSKKAFAAYWLFQMDLWTGKKPYPTFENAVMVSLDPKWAEMINRLEYKVHPEWYGDESWKRPIPKARVKV